MVRHKAAWKAEALLNSIRTDMSNSTAPAVIRRADYTPPAFLIDTVALEFDLVPERTVVRNTMRLRRNPDAAPAARLELIGEHMEFLGATLDGARTRMSAS